jgi:uncharacterized protein YbjT (DUF2867 family)
MVCRRARRGTLAIVTSHPEPVVNTDAADHTAASSIASARVLVLGASGYVGGRLVPELLTAGATVRCMTRSRRSLAAAPWGDEVEIVEGDLTDAATLDAAFDDVDQVVYLVHSLGTGDDFEARERASAEHAARAAAAAGVRRIVYLSGLGADDDALSPHLRSRHAVGRALASSGIPVTELRAAVVLGAGSASFEMLRSLVEVLPVMIAPTWVTRTKVQPIAIADVLTYLLAALRAPIDVTPTPGAHRIVQIGGPRAMTYRELMDAYADAAGLRRRVVIPVPVVTPRLSSHWVDLVTPLPRDLSRALIDSLRNDVVVRDGSAHDLSSHAPLDARAAIELAISAVDDLDIPTRWSGVSVRERAGLPRPWDADWSGGTVLEDRRETTTTAVPEHVQRAVRGIGGDRGWYGLGWMWAIRGLMDEVVGGAGMRRGRRHPDEIHEGEALDFWRVDSMDDDLFRLKAEMKVPGDAWLEWRTSVAPDGRTCVVQRARFVPRGLWGRAYWYALVPFHQLLFPTMLRRIVAAAERPPAGARSAGSGAATAA